MSGKSALPSAVSLFKCDSTRSGSTSTSYLLGRQDTIELFKKNRLCTIDKPPSCPDCFCYLSDVGWTPQANKDFITEICEDNNAEIYICLQSSELYCISLDNCKFNNMLMTEIIKPSTNNSTTNNSINYIKSSCSIFANELQQILNYPKNATNTEKKFKYITQECSFTVNTNSTNITLYLFKISSTKQPTTTQQRNFYECFKTVVKNVHNLQTGGQNKKIKLKSVPIPSKKRVLVGKINRIVYVGKRGGEYIKMNCEFKLLKK